MTDERAGDDWEELDPAMREQLRELRRQYVSEAPVRLDELRGDLTASRAQDPAALESLKTRFHKLAGSGGSYGFPAITVASREAELSLTEHPVPDAAGYAFLEEVIRRIAEAFEEAAKTVSDEQ